MIDQLFHINSYDYHLPEEQIAQNPSSDRDGARLLSVDCQSCSITDRRIPDLLDLVRPEDVLVVNDTRVFPARLQGHKDTGGRAELLLLHYPDAINENNGRAEVKGLVKSSKRPKPGSKLFFGQDLEAVVETIHQDGSVQVSLQWQGELDDVLSRYGQMPLPPYIRRESGEEKEDRLRYQTVYARENGAIAAPTAGLHFTDNLIDQITKKGCQMASVTLHVGYGTFAPVRVQDIREHAIHSEYVVVPKETVLAVDKAKAEGGRVWAVGTTSARALEYAANGNGKIEPRAGACGIYIYPGYQYQVVDNLITNFHLPKSSLLFMVSAFAGHGLTMEAYKKALEFGYRFYSYGDAMALIGDQRFT